MESDWNGKRYSQSLGYGTGTARGGEIRPFFLFAHDNLVNKLHTEQNIFLKNIEKVIDTI